LLFACQPYYEVESYTDTSLHGPPTCSSDDRRTAVSSGDRCNLSHLRVFADL